MKIESLNQYMDAAMKKAEYTVLPGEGAVGVIPAFPGLIVNAPTLRECKRELRSALEGWIIVGLPRF